MAAPVGEVGGDSRGHEPGGALQVYRARTGGVGPLRVKYQKRRLRLVKIILTEVSLE